MGKKNSNKTIHTSSARGYRAQCRPGANEVAFQVVVEQTDLHIVAHTDLNDAASRIVREQRGALQAYMQLQPEFATSLAPIEPLSGAPGIVRSMCAATAACDVGPMAAVAGTIAELVARGLCESGLTSEALVENGGDVFLCSQRERVVGLLADPAGNAALGVRIPSDSFPTALCSSSATIGHSLSLGTGDLVAVRASCGSFADAAATALCNMLRGEKGVELVLEKARELAASQAARALGITGFGVLAQSGQALGAWGEMELVAL